jgi:hypothetical protein
VNSSIKFVNVLGDADDLTDFSAGFSAVSSWTVSGSVPRNGALPRSGLRGCADFRDRSRDSKQRLSVLENAVAPARHQGATIVSKANCSCCQNRESALTCLG